MLIFSELMVNKKRFITELYNLSSSMISIMGTQIEDKFCLREIFLVMFIRDLNGEQVPGRCREGLGVYTAWSEGIQSCKNIWYIGVPNAYEYNLEFI